LLILDSPLHKAPRTLEDSCDNNWDRSYDRKLAAYPVASVAKNKFWPTVNRIDDVFVDTPFMRWRALPSREASAWLFLHTILFGGESFLLRLALALALSDLVSHKTSIDSLFLDEGLGAEFIIHLPIKNNTTEVNK
jgi:hypothetical protein